MHNMKCLLSVIVYPQHQWSDCNLVQFIYRCSTTNLHLTSAFSIPVSNKSIQNHSSVLFGTLYW